MAWGIQNSLETRKVAGILYRRKTPKIRASQPLKNLWGHMRRIGVNHLEVPADLVAVEQLAQ
jgi:hypothetical protein